MVRTAIKVLRCGSGAPARYSSTVTEQTYLTSPLVIGSKGSGGMDRRSSERGDPEEAERSRSGM